MTTRKLYYQDAYTTSFEAQVVASNADRTKTFLDQSFFYPTSGGQPHDKGRISGIEVVDVIEEDEGIAHFLATPLGNGDKVRCEVDWSRRYDHMQQHTGQHLFSAVFVEAFSIPTVSFHMGDKVSTVELKVKELPEGQMEEAEARANRIVYEARPVTVSFEDASQVQHLRKPSERTGTLRIVEIAGIDRSACGGTHVRSTSEVGSIQIRGSEKIRGNVRIEFVCGMRTVRQARQDFNTLSALAKLCATPADLVPEYIAALRQRASEMQKENGTLLENLARLEGETKYKQTPLAPDGVHRLLVHVPAITEHSRAFASAFTANRAAMLLMIGEHPPAVLLACSPDTESDAGKILGPLLARLGGRGGGSRTMAQGKLPGKEATSALLAELGFELQSAVQP